MSPFLFDAQRRECVACGGALQHPDIGRPRRYCDSDCAAEGKRESDRRHMTPARLAAMRLAKARQTMRRKAAQSPEAGQGATIDTQGAGHG